MTNVELVSREGNIARIKVTLDPKAVDKGFSAVYRELSGSLRIPGFRKGKVPPNIIRQRVGLEALQEEVAGNLRDEAFDQALRELKLTPRRGQTVWHEQGSAVEGQEFVMELSQPVLPEVSLPDLSNTRIEVARPPLTEAMLERFQSRLLDRFSAINPVEGPAGPGDSLVIGVHSRFSEGSEEAPFGGHDILYTLGKEGNLPGWDEQLAGAEAGETRDFDYTMPGDYAEAELAGQALHMHVHIDRVARVDRPVLDEEFVKSRLQFESMQQYEDYRRAVLEREIDVQLADEIANRCGRLLAEGVEANITPDMVAEELDTMVSEADSMLRHQGSSLDDYLKGKGQTIQEYRGGLQDAAVKKLKFHLGIVEFASRHGMSVGRDEIAAYAQHLMQREGIGPDEMREYLKDRNFINEISYNLIRDKVLGELAGVIKVTVLEPGGEAGAQQG